MSSIELRMATATDAAAVAQLHADSWRRTYRGILRDDFLDGDLLADRRSLWDQRLQSPNEQQLVLLAEEQGSLVGFACMFGAADPIWGMLLDNLHVIALAHGRGIGKTLIHHAAMWSRERLPNAGIYLWVFEANAPARRFYEKLGAQAAERVTMNAPGGGSAVELRYAWRDIDRLCHVTRSPCAPTVFEWKSERPHEPEPYGGS